MPYELSFTKPISVEDPEIYWNECCWGGDRVSDHLLPMIRGKYENIRMIKKVEGVEKDAVSEQIIEDELIALKNENQDLLDDIAVHVGQATLDSVVAKS